MPKYRQLHTKIVDSFDFAEMPDDFTRVFWLLLIVVVDSEGRGIDNPAWLRSRMFPLRQDIDFRQIEEAMIWLATRGMIICYEVDGRYYFTIPTFRTYQSGTEKEAKSVLPPCPELLQTYSRVTPELLRVNTIQYNTDSNTIQPGGVVFTKFQNEISMLTPKTSETVGGWIDDYPEDWIISAIDIAVENNARKPNYIDAILKRWKVDGKSNGSKPQPKQKTMEEQGYQRIE